jgi:hypothetical protein
MDELNYIQKEIIQIVLLIVAFAAVYAINNREKKDKTFL